MSAKERPNTTFSTESTTSAIVPAQPEVSPQVARLVDAATEYMAQSRAANTRRAYQTDWVDFVAWCTRHMAVPVPADPRVVALYLTDLAEGGPGRRPKRVTTLKRRLAAIRYYHRREGHELNLSDPVLRDTWRGLKRVFARPPQRKAPTVTEFLRALVDTLPSGADEPLSAARDRALLLIGFAGCLRRSELVGLDVSDCAFGPEGVTVTLRRSKTDQEGAGMVKGIPHGQHPETCPVRALDRWLTMADITAGPVFRPIPKGGARVRARRLTTKSVAIIIKETVHAARAAAIERGNRWLADSLDPAKYAGHSLRAGFITSAAAAGVSESDIMRHSGHTRSDTLREYIRHATVFRQNAAAKVGL